MELLRTQITKVVDKEIGRLKTERKLLKLVLGDARDEALAKSNEADELLVLASVKEVMDQE